MNAQRRRPSVRPGAVLWPMLLALLVGLAFALPATAAGQEATATEPAPTATSGEADGSAGAAPGPTEPATTSDTEASGETGTTPAPEPVDPAPVQEPPVTSGSGSGTSGSTPPVVVTPTLPVVEPVEVVIVDSPDLPSAPRHEAVPPAAPTGRVEVATTVALPASPATPPDIPSAARTGAGPPPRPDLAPAERSAPSAPAPRVDRRELVAKTLDASPVSPASERAQNKHPFSYGLAGLGPVEVAPSPAAPSSPRSGTAGPMAPEPASGSAPLSPLTPRLDSPEGPTPSGELLEVLAAYVLPGTGAPTSIVILGLLQIATVLLVFALPRPRALMVALVPLVRRRRAGYRAVVLRPG